MRLAFGAIVDVVGAGVIVINGVIIWVVVLATSVAALM